MEIAFEASAYVLVACFPLRWSNNFIILSFVNAVVRGARGPRDEAYIFAITLAILFGNTGELHQFLSLAVIAAGLTYFMMEWVAVLF